MKLYDERTKISRSGKERLVIKMKEFDDLVLVMIPYEADALEGRVRAMLKEVERKTFLPFARKLWELGTVWREKASKRPVVGADSSVDQIARSGGATELYRCAEQLQQCIRERDSALLGREVAPIDARVGGGSPGDGANRTPSRPESAEEGE